MQALYLNNTGSRWKVPGRMGFYTYEEDEFGTHLVKRTADCFEACGHFAAYVFRLGRHRYSRFPLNFWTFNGLPIVDMVESGSDIDDDLRRLGAIIA